MRRTVLPLVICALTALGICLPGGAAWSSAISSAPAPSSRTSPDLSSPTTLDPDDDNVAEELTYHWQNALYYQDERCQIGYILAFLCLVAASGYVRRVLHLRRYGRLLAPGDVKA